MAERLFQRDVAINVGGLRIASRLNDDTRRQLGIAEDAATEILKVTFRITKTLGKEPNECELQIYNLRKENRIALQKKNQETIIEAGYVDNTSILFRGNLEYSNSVRDGRDWITTLQGSDGSRKMKSSRVNLSRRGPASVKNVLSAVAGAFGAGKGNLSDVLENGSVRGKIEFKHGVVLSGKAYDQLVIVAGGMGYNVSVQDGQMLFLAKSIFKTRVLNYIGTQATLLTPETGLVGSPEPGDKGFIDVRTMIQPNLLPGHRVRVQAGEVDGFYRIERVDFSGDTWGDDWYADLECRPLGVS